MYTCDKILDVTNDGTPILPVNETPLGSSQPPQDPLTLECTPHFAVDFQATEDPVSHTSLDISDITVKLQTQDNGTAFPSNMESEYIINDDASITS